MLTLTFSAETPFNISVSDFEARQNRPVPTWEVLDNFQALHRDREIVFLAGDDCLEDFQRWTRASYIAGKYVFLIGPRGSPPVGGLGLTLPRIEIVSLRRPYAVSSTQVRELMLDGKSTEGLLHPLVREYIVKHSLYGKTERVEEGSTK
jgi:nicotinate (nicotinamide) nucleotide adenylyltransferase